MFGKQFFLSVLTMHRILIQDIIVWKLTKVPNHLKVFDYYYLHLNMKKKEIKIKTASVFPNHFFLFG